MTLTPEQAAKIISDKAARERAAEAQRADDIFADTPQPVVQAVRDNEINREGQRIRKPLRPPA